MSTTEAFPGAQHATQLNATNASLGGSYAHQFFQGANAQQAQQLSASATGGTACGLSSSQQFCYAGLPDPTSVQKQKETYLRLLDSQLQQGVQALDVQLKQQRDAINSQAEQQKKAFNMQVDMEVSISVMINIILGVY